MLAAGFVWAAWMKLAQPADALAVMWPWTAEHPALTHVTGVLDALAATGLILPIGLRIWPGLTPLAAAGAVLLMVAAIIFHLLRGETGSIGFNVFFGLMAGVVWWGRRRKEPGTR